MKMVLKISLLSQSLLPLYILVFVLNIHDYLDIFTKGNSSNFELQSSEWVLIIMESLIGFLIIIVGISFLFVRNYVSHGEEIPETILKLDEKNDISLDFFMSYLVPIIVSDLSSITHVIVFLLMLIFICILLLKTKLYFLNPILIAFGYSLYLVDTLNVKNSYCVCRKKLKVNDLIRYKKIEENIIYGRKKQ